MPELVVSLQWISVKCFHDLSCTKLVPRIFKSRERCKVSSNLLLNVNIKELRRNLCRSKGTLHGCVLNFKSIKHFCKINSDQKARPLLSTTKSAKKWKPTEPQAWGTALEMEMTASIAYHLSWKSMEIQRVQMVISQVQQLIYLSVHWRKFISSHDPRIKTTWKQPWQPSSLGLPHLISFTSSNIWSLFKFLSPFCRRWYHLHPSSHIVGSRWNLGNFPRHIGSAIQFRSSPQPRRLEHVRWDKHGG